MATQILIIEDDRDIRETACEFLEMEGFTVHASMNGAEGLAFLNEAGANLPRLIFVDLRMPVMDGPTFLQRRLNDPKLNAIPTVVLSAESDFKAKCLALGATDVLRKPIDLTAFVELARKYVEALPGLP